MKISKKIKIDGQNVTITEPSMGEIRAWLGGMAAGFKSSSLNDVIDDLIVPGQSLKVLYLLTDITPDTLANFTPSQAAEILEACREVVPGFFGMLDKLVAASKTATPPQPSSAT